MGKAYDAMFDYKSKGPSKSFSLLFFLILIFSSCCFAKERLYKEKDIPVVMERIFEYHVESKQINEKILKRILKIYLESFDSEKVYLLKNDAMKFLDVSDDDVKSVISKINKKDFSYFYNLNSIFNRAVLKAEKTRESICKDILNKNLEENSKRIEHVEYSSDEKDLMERQKDYFLYFCMLQKKRANLDDNISLEQKNKIIKLYEKKMRSHENKYLISKSENSKQEHDFVVNFLKAFAKSLDTHTYFFSEEEARDMRISLEKQFEGIGVVLSESIDGVVITGMLANSPAKESKRIEEGDIITEINKEDVTDASFETVLSKMKYKDKNRIELGLKRKDISEIVRVQLTARPLSMDEDRLTFSSEKVDGGVIGKLVLKSFYENQDGVSSESDLRNAITQLRKEGDLKGLVLDLRDNSGGFLSQAVKVAGLFMSNGVVVMSKYSKDEIRFLRTFEGSALYNGPLVILISKMSASAAEIVAQALQDYGVALIVGDERTFGKGSIQYQTITNENADFYFKVTVGRYYTVSGKSTQIDGVKADIVVPSTYNFYDIGERFLEYSLESDQIPNAYNDTLRDVDEGIRRLFKKSYSKNLQKVVNVWRDMLPSLVENSKERTNGNSDYKLFLKSRQESSKNTEIKNKHFNVRDFQVQESVNIIKDMMFFQQQNRKAS